MKHSIESFETVFGLGKQTLSAQAPVTELVLKVGAATVYEFIKLAKELYEPRARIVYEMASNAGGNAVAFVQTELTTLKTWIETELEKYADETYAGQPISEAGVPYPEIHPGTGVLRMYKAHIAGYINSGLQDIEDGLRARFGAVDYTAPELPYLSIPLAPKEEFVARFAQTEVQSQYAGKLAAAKVLLGQNFTPAQVMLVIPGLRLEDLEGL